MIEVENYCNTCLSTLRGLCCYHSLYDGTENIAVYPCKYLSKKTRRCTIYKKRFKINKNCLDIDKAYSEGALPKDCPYVKDYDYPPVRPFKTVNVKKLLEMRKNNGN